MQQDIPGANPPPRPAKPTPFPVGGVDFCEEDEPVEDVIRDFEAGQRGQTKYAEMTTTRTVWVLTWEDDDRSSTVLGIFSDAGTARRFVNREQWTEWRLMEPGGWVAHMSAGHYWVREEEVK